MPFVVRRVFSRLIPGLALITATGLAGCTTSSAYDKLRHAQPGGSAFARALFADYSYLARSLGLAETPSATSFDAQQSYSLSGLDADAADVANGYVEKALQAARGEEPLPEAAPTDDDRAETARMRLLRALDKGRAKAPAVAARTQAEYDCWIMNAQADSLAQASAQCQRAFVRDLARLEQLAPVTQKP